MHEPNLNSEAPSQVEGPDVAGGIRAGPTLAAALYLLLLGSAALCLFAQRFPGTVPAGLARLSPWLFLIFVACFAIYRLALVRAKKYPVSKAFFQVGAGLFFFTLLLLPRGPFAEVASDPVEVLMTDGNPAVRALAMEVTRYRPDGNRYARQLVRGLSDPDPRVRREARASLARWAGTDLGDPETPDGLEAWRKRFP